MRNINILSFRAEPSFVEQTEQMAAFAGLDRSAYLHRAVEELNRKTQQQRFLAIVDRLADSTAQESKALDHLAGEGLSS